MTAFFIVGGFSWGSGFFHCAGVLASLLDVVATKTGKALGIAFTLLVHSYPLVEELIGRFPMVIFIRVPSLYLLGANHSEAHPESEVDF